MKKTIAGVLMLAVLVLTGCSKEYPEKKISFGDYEGVTIEYACNSSEGA